MKENMFICPVCATVHRREIILPTVDNMDHQSVASKKKTVFQFLMSSSSSDQNVHKIKEIFGFDYHDSSKKLVLV